MRSTNESAPNVYRGPPCMKSFCMSMTNKASIVVNIELGALLKALLMKLDWRGKKYFKIYKSLG